MDISKYKFVTHTSKEHGSKQITAISTYAGRIVKGYAKCDPRDNYTEANGMELAAARCGVKIAEKRYHRALAKRDEAVLEVQRALAHMHKMEDYVAGASEKFQQAEDDLAEILSTL